MNPDLRIGTGGPSYDRLGRKPDNVHQIYVRLRIHADPCAFGIDNDQFVIDVHDLTHGSVGVIGAEISADVK
jgi:hypothetical protein